jgi:hypothetical protein
MDAVELPLPAKMEFGKILAPAEGVDEAAAGGGGGEVLRRCADADRRHGGGILSLSLSPRSILCCGAFILSRWKKRVRFEFFVAS